MQLPPRHEGVAEVGGHGVRALPTPTARELVGLDQLGHVARPDSGTDGPLRCGGVEEDQGGAADVVGQGTSGRVLLAGEHGVED